MSSNLQRAAALLGALRDGEVRHVVASPGSRSTPLVLVAEALGLQLHMVLDERAAAFVALGLARATEAAVALVCTSGSAGAHWLPALIEASASGVSLVAITADRPAPAQYVGAPQTIDQTGLFGAHVRRSFALSETSSEGQVRLVALQALALGGPVHVNMAFDEPLWSASEPFCPPPAVTLTRSQRVGHAPEALREAALNARRGLLVVGAHSSPAARQATLEVGARLGWPILADAASGLRFEASTPRDAELALVSRGEAIVRTQAAELHPDLVIRVGHAPTTRAVQEWLAGLEAPVWLLNDGAVHDPAARAEHLVLGPPEHALRHLADLRPMSDPAYRATWMAAERAAAHALDAAAAHGLWEGAVTARVLASASPEHALVVASSMPIRDADLFVGSGRGRWYVNRGANGIDGLVATAAGAALAANHRAAGGLLLLGDLAFRHDLSGLQAARQLTVDCPGFTLRVVVVDNGGGGIFGFLPIAEHPAFERCFLTPQATDVAALARGVGALTTEVTTREGLDAALALRAQGLETIVVRVDREHSKQRRRDALEAATRAAAEALVAAREAPR